MDQDKRMTEKPDVLKYYEEILEKYIDPDIRALMRPSLFAGGASWAFPEERGITGNPNLKKLVGKARKESWAFRADRNLHNDLLKLQRACDKSDEKRVNDIWNKITPSLDTKLNKLFKSDDNPVSEISNRLARLKDSLDQSAELKEIGKIADDSIMGYLYRILWNYLGKTFEKLQTEKLDDVMENLCRPDEQVYEILRKLIEKKNKVTVINACDIEQINKRFRDLMIKSSAGVRYSSNFELAAFDTGLVDKQFRPIIAVFEKIKYLARPYSWKGVFSDPKEPLAEEARNKNIGDLNRAKYFYDADASDRVYVNPKAEVGEGEGGWGHIIGDGILKDRFPDDFLSAACDKKDLEDLRDVKKKSMKDKRKAIADFERTESFNNVKSELIEALKVARDRVARDYRTAIPMWYKDSKVQKITFLLPLYLMGKNTPDVALAVAQTKNGSEYIYNAWTVLTLDMTYNNSRLVCMPGYDGWLKPKKFKNQLNAEAEGHRAKLVPPVNASDLVYVNPEPENSREMLGNMADIIKDLEELTKVDNIEGKLIAALEHALNRIVWNYKTAIPAWDPKEEKTGFLLPLYLTDRDKNPPDYALMVQQKPNHDKLGYEHTADKIFTLDMIYDNLQLLFKPEPGNDWLDPRKITWCQTDGGDF